MKYLIFIISIVLLYPVCGNALEIPLSGGSSQAGGQKIAFVDLDKIFDIFPQTKNAKEDYANRLSKMREMLGDREKDIENLQNQINILETTLKDLNNQPSTSTETVTNQNASQSSGEGDNSVSNLKNQLETKKAELDELKKSSAQELQSFENQQNQIILGKIYRALKELASEEQVSLVVDKRDILYGSVDIDLTEKLQERVRGF